MIVRCLAASVYESTVQYDESQFGPDRSFTMFVFQIIYPDVICRTPGIAVRLSTITSGRDLFAGLMKMALMQH